MSFDWKGYIVLAEELLSQQKEVSTEACARSAISRAYYGAFCIARNKKGFKNSESNINIHWKVINEYRSSNIESEKIIGYLLDDLRKARNNADYNEDKVIDMELAKRSLEMAKEILIKIEDEHETN